ncbi:NAD(P)H-dependent glycerol-3-phosphate dehydrogenase, partial [Lactobacillus delbrueckii subsp. bulgaricus]|nr:glycerol-3-phosphate dehydrogenase [Lactobacillus delbrueckii subsp. bulgaricus]MBT8986941.1 glycerol-3-phosphate dehydrogenase [Lactobacillus delbrueckii subsp. bulgaricus]
GYLIGKGKSAEEAKKEVGMVVEGINAIPAALELADKYDVEMPIVFAVDAVVNRGADARETVDALMLREKKSEMTK